MWSQRPLGYTLAFATLLRLSLWETKCWTDQEA